jgi:hypothetical protein
VCRFSSSRHEFHDPSPDQLRFFGCPIEIVQSGFRMLNCSQLFILLCSPTVIIVIAEELTYKNEKTPPELLRKGSCKKAGNTYSRAGRTTIGPNSLTAVFGMGTGVSSWVWSPASCLESQETLKSTYIDNNLGAQSRHEREREQCGQTFGC